MNIFELQAWLVKLGESAIAVDGKWGWRSDDAAKRVLKAAGYDTIRGSVRIALEQHVMKVIGGLSVGPVDGFVGPITIKARKHWDQGNWRSPLMDANKADKRFPAPVQNTWPLQSQMEAFYGAPGTNMTQVQLPFPMVLAWDTSTEIMKFSCNEKVKDSLGRVYKSILASYGFDRIEELGLNLFGGCVNVRNMRGGKNLSTHAYGAAVDTDPVRNSLRSTRETARLARPEYEQFWNAWTAEGWLSLGKARDFDWMHVQAARLG